MLKTASGCFEQRSPSLPEESLVHALQQPSWMLYALSFDGSATSADTDSFQDVMSIFEKRPAARESEQGLGLRSK